MKLRRLPPVVLPGIITLPARTGAVPEPCGIGSMVFVFNAGDVERRFAAARQKEARA